MYIYTHTYIHTYVDGGLRGELSHDLRAHAGSPHRRRLAADRGPQIHHAIIISLSPSSLSLLLLLLILLSPLVVAVVAVVVVIAVVTQLSNQASLRLV